MQPPNIFKEIPKIFTRLYFTPPKVKKPMKVCNILFNTPTRLVVKAEFFAVHKNKE